VGVTADREQAARDRWADGLRLLAPFSTEIGSPFYGTMLECMARDVADGGPTWPLLEPFTGEPPENVYHIRLLGGVHRLVLTGAAPELARHYPSAGGDGDAEAAWPLVRELLATRPPVVLDALTRPPQTNEVGRSAPLVGGLLVVARDTKLPSRLRELGSSAGLNLWFDRYWFSQDGQGWGDPTSTVRFVDLWPNGSPPFDAGMSIADRRGCDRHPIDVTSDDGRLWLLAYVWPDQTARFELLRTALDLARDAPPAVDEAEIPEWLETQLAESTPGVATVVFHSIVWQYLTAKEKAAVEATLHEAGRRATVDAPLAWLRLELGSELSTSDLRLTTWPGGAERLLAHAAPHLGPVEWLDER
jgi:hypothetical protein